MAVIRIHRSRPQIEIPAAGNTAHTRIDGTLHLHHDKVRRIEVSYRIQILMGRGRCDDRTADILQHGTSQIGILHIIQKLLHIGRKRVM